MNYLIKCLLVDLALDLLDRTISHNMAVQSPEDISDMMEWTDEKEAELNAIRSSPAYQQMMEWYRNGAAERAIQD